MKISPKPRGRRFDEVVVEGSLLAKYRAHPQLYSPLIHELMKAAEDVRAILDGRRIWHINSVAFGGGVAEILPPHICLLRELGFDIGWLVFKPRDPAFFRFTKGIHNELHAKSVPGLDQLTSSYVAESVIGMEDLETILGNDDILIVHDPQPLCAAARFLDRRPLPAIWRCHIGYPGRNPTVDHAWGILTNFLQPFEHVVLSDEAYAFESPVPTSFIQPSICPFSPKNRAYHAPATRELLENVKIYDGSKQSDTNVSALFDSRYFLHVSRWDALKGIDRVVEAFSEFCRSSQLGGSGARDRIRLVVAGPDPDSVADDPEGLAYFHHCQSICDALPTHVRRRIDLTCISMEDYNINAEIVGRLQQHALGVFQLSRQEGFGLTSTEALFRARPLVVSSAFGLQLQVTDGETGTVLSDPDIHIKASNIMSRISDGSDEIESMAQRGRDTCIRSSTQIAKAPQWLRVISDAAKAFDVKQRLFQAAGP